MIVSEREIQELCDKIVKEFNPDKVILFGSYARGEQRDWSDVDIMVVLPHEGNGIDESVMMRRKVRPDFPA
jgi:predicted nucleotidyltransferase